MARIISEDNPTWPSHFCITIISTTHHNTSQHNTQTKHVLCAVSCSCTTYKSFLTTRQWMNRKYCSCEVNEDLNQDSEKKYLYFTLILNSLTKRHTERYREREREREREDCQSNLCTDSLSSLSVFPSWFQGLLLLSAQTKIWFLSHIILSPQKSHFYLLLRKILTLSFCSNSLSPEMVHAFKVILFCFVLFHYGNFLWYSLLWGLSVCVFSLSGSKKKKFLEFPMLLFCFCFSILIFLNG